MYLHAWYMYELHVHVHVHDCACTCTCTLTCHVSIHAQQKLEHDAIPWHSRLLSREALVEAENVCLRLQALIYAQYTVRVVDYVLRDFRVNLKMYHKIGIKFKACTQITRKPIDLSTTDFKLKILVSCTCSRPTQNTASAVKYIVALLLFV